MNHNDNQDFTPQSAGEETAAEVAEETAAKTNENPAAEASVHAEAKAAETPAAATPKNKKGMLGWIIAIIAVAALVVVFVLDARKPAEPVEEPSTTPTETEAPETAAPSALDFDAAYNKYAPETTVFTVNGTPVPWSEYYCWIYNVVNTLATNYGITDWNTPLDDTLTAETYILEAAMSQSCQYPLIYGKAEELGIALDEENLAQIDSIIATDVELYYGGDKDAFLSELASLYVNEDYYRTMGGTSILYEKIFSHYFGEYGANLSDADALAFLADNEFMHAKHILFKTVDDAMQPLEESVVAEKRAQAEAVLAELKALPAEGFEEAFDAIMAEKSEDPGSKSYPAGYYFQTGKMVEAFENTTKELADGAFSDIVESPYGYHIIYRPVMHADDLFEYDNTGAALTVRHAAAVNLFNNMTADWAMNMEVVLEPEFETLSLNSLFDVQ